jgi:prolipoprotein diacylglyceryltransferase
MYQVLFRIPIRVFDWMPSWLPTEIPIFGYGAMLFLAFIFCSRLAAWRAAKENLQPAHIYDVTIWLFACGIFGARVTFMIENHRPISEFFVIWRGGLVFYGSFIGGVIGYGLWRATVEGTEVVGEFRMKLITWTGIGAVLGALALWFRPLVAPPQGIALGAAIGAVAGFSFTYILSIRKNAPENWQLMDVLAPSVALGLAIGRVGCLLNGCCFGNVACTHCPAVHFPLSAPPRGVYTEMGLQTAAGFTSDSTSSDPRTRVAAVEPGSPAQAAGVQAGDRIVGVNKVENRIILEVVGEEGTSGWNSFLDYLRNNPRDVAFVEPGRAHIFYEDMTQTLEEDKTRLRMLPLRVGVTDVLHDRLVRDWPAGINSLSLMVVHPDSTTAVELPEFSPKTLYLHPTQIYETISALLILMLLSAYFPFRRHYGEVFALFMMCYAVHRFINEMLRNDNAIAMADMTLSQNISIMVFATGALLFAWVSFKAGRQTVPAV